MRRDVPDALEYWEGASVADLESMWGVPGLVVLDRVDSTNARLRDLGDSVPDFTVLIAEEQVAGKGRNGTVWSSPRGGLWFSLIFRPRSPAARPLVPLRVGLGVARALRAECGVDVGIKWPNDLWVGDRKLAGILVEGTAGQLVIGIGVNVDTTPDPATCRTPPIHLRDAAGRAVSRVSVLGAILHELVGSLGRGGAALRDDELELLRSLDRLEGRWVRVRPGPEGVARGVDRSGRLIVETPDGPVPVVSGTVEIL